MKAWRRCCSMNSMSAACMRTWDLALCLQAQETVAPQLRLLVMSATLDAAAVAALLGNAPVIAAEGRMFPVDLHYVGKGLPCIAAGTHVVRRANSTRWSRQCARVLGEDTRAMSWCSCQARRRSIGCAASSSRAARDRMSRFTGCTVTWTSPHNSACWIPPAAGRRKLILATNIAETSLTIPGVRVVSRRRPRATFAVRSLDGHGAAGDGAHLAGVRHPARGSRRSHRGRQCVARFGVRARRPRWRRRRRRKSLSTDLAPMVLELAVWGVATQTNCAGSTCRPKRAWRRPAIC